MERIAQAMLKADEAEEQIVIDRRPAWAEPRPDLRPEGYFTDPETVPNPVVLGRAMTDDELVAYKTQVLADRRTAEAERLEGPRATAGQPEHLNDAARQIKESMQRGRRGHEEDQP